MKIDNNSLKSLYQGYLSSRIPENRNHCPTPSEINRFFNSSFSWRYKKKLIDHLSNCTYCSRDFYILLCFHGLEIPPTISPIVNSGAKKHTAGKPFIRLFNWRFASVIIGFSLFAFSISSIVLKHELSKGMRANNRMIINTYPSNDHSLLKPLVFRWRDRIGAQYYILEIFNENLTPFWKSTKLLDSHFLLPETIRARLIIGNTYYWMITSYAHLEKVNESELISFKVLAK